MPVQAQFLGHVLDGAGATAPADMPGKPLCVEGIVGKEVQMLLSLTAVMEPPMIGVMEPV
jgi:hypothetical protein